MMIKETARIIAIEEREAGKVAVLECISKSACSSCNSKNSCGVGTVAKAFSDKTHQVTIPYTTGMQVDEYIELKINGRDLISSAIYAYLVPIIFFIGAAVIAQQIFPMNEGKVILSAFISAGVAFILIHLITKNIFSETKLKGIVEAKIKNND